MQNNGSLSFTRVDEFKRDLKKLKKKYKTLETDLIRFELILKGLFPEVPTGAKRISRLGENVKVPIYKAKHFYCKCLNKGSRSGFRVIFAFLEDEFGVVFIEIYYKSKNSRTNHNKKRILKYFEEKDV